MPMSQPSGYDNLALVTDQYELTMAQSYLHQGMTESATFSLFTRQYPLNRGYFVSAGLEAVLHYLQELHFTGEDIDYLRATRLFAGDFLEYLRAFRFTGEVHAIPEGRLFFKDEPVLEVTAPIIEAQVVETYLINQVNLQSLIATKAARCVTAGRGRALVDFSLRRAQGVDAGLKVARCSYLVGFAATSNVRAGQRYGIPISGTMAHSYVTAFEHEMDAFRTFARSFPDNTVLLIDTYDTVAAAHKAVQVAREMEATGHRLRGVRLDSGDLVSLSQQVRRIFREAGLDYVSIFASGGLDEYELDELLGQGAEIDGFGVGTRMGVSADAPWYDMAYKLVKYDSRPVLKLSTGKVTLADQKQVFRLYNKDGNMERDVIALRDEPPPHPAARPLLQKVMEDGRILEPLPSLNEIRQTFQDEFARLDPRIKALTDPDHYRVEVSPRLKALQDRLERQVAAQEVKG